MDEDDPRPLNPVRFAVRIGGGAVPRLSGAWPQHVPAPVGELVSERVRA
jgi:hypothetical protein